ncbi:hypothetical protein LINPERPRIM_LOCUS11974, partial [Linum perenne]
MSQRILWRISSGSSEIRSSASPAATGIAVDFPRFFFIDLFGSRETIFNFERFVASQAKVWLTFRLGWALNFYFCMVDS